MQTKKNKNLLQQNLAGFTLIEIVIAVAIFSLLSTVVGGIYVAFSQSQTRTQAGQKLLGEMQFSLESIAREIRNGEIDYNVDCDNDFAATICLVLERSDNTKIAFIFKQEKLIYQVNDGTSWGVVSDTLLPVAGSSLESFKFIVSPDADPFVDEDPNRMPIVTIQAQMKATGRDIEQVTYNLQTSASSRIFPE